MAMVLEKARDFIGSLIYPKLKNPKVKSKQARGFYFAMFICSVAYGLIAASTDPIKSTSFVQVAGHGDLVPKYCDNCNGGTDTVQIPDIFYKAEVDAVHGSCTENPVNMVHLGANFVMNSVKLTEFMSHFMTGRPAVLKENIDLNHDNFIYHTENTGTTGWKATQQFFFEYGVVEQTVYHKATINTEFSCTISSPDQMKCTVGTTENDFTGQSVTDAYNKMGEFLQSRYPNQYYRIDIKSMMTRLIDAVFYREQKVSFVCERVSYTSTIGVAEGNVGIVLVVATLIAYYLERRYSGTDVMIKFEDPGDEGDENSPS